MPKKYSYAASKRFVKDWSKLNSETKNETAQKIDVFLRNPYSPVLKTHKLKGELKNYWSFSISHRLRIFFRFEKANIVELVDIGGHEVYQ